MNSEFLDTLAFSLSVTGPILVILGLGGWLRRIGMLNDAFIEVGSRLMFKVTLPAVLFVLLVVALRAARRHISSGMPRPAKNSTRRT